MLLPSVPFTHNSQPVPALDSQKVPELVVKEIVRLGLRADRERADPSLGMGFTLEDAKALRQAASRRVDLSSSSSSSARCGGICAEEALYARVQAEVVKEDKVGYCTNCSGSLVYNRRCRTYRQRLRLGRRRSEQILLRRLNFLATGCACAHTAGEMCALPRSPGGDT